MLIEQPVNDLVELQGRIEADRKAAFPKPGDINAYRNYARGRQRSTLTPDQRKVLTGVVGNQYCDNVCKRILVVLTGRIRLLKLNAPDKAMQAFLDELFVKNKLKRLSKKIHWMMWRDCAAGLTLKWDADGARVKTLPERIWNGRDGIYFNYTDDGEVEYAVKEWRERNNNNALRRTVFWANRIERYISQGNGWEWLVDDNSDEGTDAENGAPGRHWWTSDRTKNGEPLGHAAVHFPRDIYPADASDQDKDNEGDNYQGVSMLSGGMLGIQDNINDHHMTLTAAARHLGYQIVTGTGITPRFDVSGNEIPIKIRPGTLLLDKNVQAKFGFIPAGDVTQLIAALDKELEAAARTAVIPEHEIKGQWPSGEAIMQANQPLVDQANDGVDCVFTQWQAVAVKAARIHNTFAPANLNDRSLIMPEFDDTERYDEMTKLKLANEKSGHVSNRETLRLYGYNQQEQDKILDDRRKEDSLLGGME